MCSREGKNALKTLLVSALIVIAGVYFAVTSTTTTVTEPEYTLTEQKPGFKTYQNNNLGFQVSYPTDVFSIEPGPEGLTLMSSYSVEENGEKEIPETEFTHAFSVQFALKNLAILDAIERHDPYGDDFLQAFPKGTLESFAQKGETAVRHFAAGKSGYRFRIGIRGINTDYFFLPKNDKETLLISYTYFTRLLKKSPITEKRENEIFNAMLASLSFL